jgi:phage-related protein
MGFVRADIMRLIREILICIAEHIYNEWMRLLILREVHDFIEGLEKSTQAKWSRQITLLQAYGSTLGMPYSRRINSSLSELRVRGKQEVRGFYTIHGDYIVMLHAFVKKSQKIPQKEIDTAEKRKKFLT